MDSRTMVEVAAIVETLNEVAGRSSPASIIYIGIGCDLSRWMALQTLLCSAGLVTVAGNVVTLTERGAQLAREITKAKQAV